MRILAAVMIALAFAAGCAHQPPEPTPLYDAFAKYCVATGARTDAVEKAVTADGGVLQDVHVEIVKIESTTWKLGNILVVAGPARVLRQGPDGKPVLAELAPPGSKADNCGIRTLSENDASRAPIAQWAGVPPLVTDDAKRFGDDLNDKYYFRIAEGRHVPEGDRVTAVKSGGAWFVLYWRRGKDTGVTLRHYYMPD